MARPPAGAHDVATSERLLAAACRAFGRSGFEAARLSDIAAEAGIGRASLLYHWGSKEALYAAAVERTFARLAEALATARSAEGPLEDRLDTLVVSFTDFLDAHEGLAPLVLREVIDRRGPGADLVLAAALPVLDDTAAWLSRAAYGRLRRGVQVRSALLSLVCTALVRAASGPLRSPLFGVRDDLPRLARLTLLEDPR